MLTVQRPMLITCFWVLVVTLGLIGGWSAAPG